MTLYHCFRTCHLWIVRYPYLAIITAQTVDQYVVAFCLNWDYFLSLCTSNRTWQSCFSLSYWWRIDYSDNFTHFIAHHGHSLMVNTMRLWVRVPTKPVIAKVHSQANDPQPLKRRFYVHSEMYLTLVERRSNNVLCAPERVPFTESSEVRPRTYVHIPTHLPENQKHIHAVIFSYVHSRLYTRWWHRMSLCCYACVCVCVCAEYYRWLPNCSDSARDSFSVLCRGRASATKWLRAGLQSWRWVCRVFFMILWQMLIRRQQVKFTRSYRSSFMAWSVQRAVVAVPSDCHAGQMIDEQVQVVNTSNYAWIALEQAIRQQKKVYLENNFCTFITKPCAV